MYEREKDTEPLFGEREGMEPCAEKRGEEKIRNALSLKSKNRLKSV